MPAHRLPALSRHLTEYQHARGRGKCPTRSRRYGWRMDPEVRQLRALLAVVDAGTFTGAADVLGVSQASVSRTVAVAGAHARRPRAAAHDPRGVADRGRRAGRRARPAGARGGRRHPARRRPGARRPPRRLRLVGARPAHHRGPAPVVGHASGLGAALRPVPHRDRRSDRRRRRRERAAPAGRATPACGPRCWATRRRYAAVAADDPLARRRSAEASATSPTAPSPSTRSPGPRPRSCGPPTAAPAGTRTVRGIEDWLTVIAAGPGVGMSSEATAAQHRRPGVVYRPVRDAPPVSVWLAWWADSPPARRPGPRAAHPRAVRPPTAH